MGSELPSSCSPAGSDRVRLPMQPLHLCPSLSKIHGTLFVLTLPSPHSGMGLTGAVFSDPKSCRRGTQTWFLGFIPGLCQYHRPAAANDLLKQSFCRTSHALAESGGGSRWATLQFKKLHLLTLTTCCRLISCSTGSFILVHYLGKQCSFQSTAQDQSSKMLL